MTTRDRTSLFIQYRSSFGKNIGIAKRGATGVAGGADDAEGLLVDQRAADGSVAVEMANLPPKWMDVIEEIQEDISRLKDKISQVEQMHKKNILPGFDDMEKEMVTIEKISQQITSELYNIQKRIKKVQDDCRFYQKQEEQIMARNACTRLATGLQELSGRFRQSQSNYLNKIRGMSSKGNNLFQPSALDAAMPNRFDMGFTEQQLTTIHTNEEAIDRRSKEINDIAKNITQMAELFRDLQTMIVDQGTLLDRIDYNIENMNTSVKAAHEELIQGEKYQKSSKRKTVMIFLVVLVVILFIAVLAKRSRK